MRTQTMAWKPYKDIEIDKRYKPAARKAIAADVIDFIIKRTLKGKKPDGEPYPGYSDSYKKSLDFKIAGKNKNKVNLRLSFEMLNSIVLRNDSAGRIRIGIADGDTTNIKKAEGNSIGSYGGEPNKKKERPFLDISDSDLKKIEAKYPIENKTSLQEAIATAQAIRAAAKKVADDVKT